MSASLHLPKKENDIPKAVSQMVHESGRVRNLQSVKWWMCHYYLRGDRHFTDIDYLNGTIDVSYPNATGIDFKYEEIVRRYQEAVGQLLRMDTTPKVSKRAASLNALRNASVSQLVLDYLVSKQDAQVLKKDFITLLARYGTAALVVERGLSPEDAPDTHVKPFLEVVPPWELLPVPANPNTSDDARGIIRSRWVPLQWVRSLGYQQKLDANKEDIETRDGTYGQTPDSHAGTRGGGAPDGSTMESLMQGHDWARDTSDDPETVKYIKINELWIYSPRKRLDHYVITSGKVLLDHRDFAGRKDKPIVPIHAANYIDVGGFWGRSLTELLLYVNVEIESLLGSLLQNVEELDLFGYLMVPTDQGIDLNSFTPSDGPRVIPFEPSLANPEGKVYNIGPSNTGTLPGKVADLAMGLFDRIAPSSELLGGNAPGRADSGAAFSQLFEYSTIPYSLPANSIANAYAGAYAALLDVVRNSWSTMEVAAAAMVDDSVAGVVIDPSTGVLDLTNNPVPDPSLINVGITSRETKSRQEKREELMAMLDKMTISAGGPTQNAMWFRILSRKLGLDLPVASEAEWQNYRRAMFNNIVLFGDGNRPGQVIVHASDRHELHLELIGAFMARPEFMLATQQVRDAFEKLRTEHMMYIGDFPDQIDYPEDGAERSEAQLDQLGALPE